MKKNRGFTLVELLAVIVVLAVIMVIAIPNVIKVIDKAKLNSYKRNEDMLVSATQKYMASNGISLNIGETTPITYSQLQNDKLIDKITDQTSKGECSKSKIYVTKTSNGYTYKAGLVCDNYISLDTFNIILNNDFSQGGNSWSLSYGVSTIANNILSLEHNNNSQIISYINDDNANVRIANNIYYGQSSVRVTNSNCSKIRLLMAGGGALDQTNPNINEWYNMKKRYQSSSNGNSVISLQQYYIDAPTAMGKIMQVKDVLVLNLTAIYGSGNEPAQDVIDALVNKSK